VPAYIASMEPWQAGIAKDVEPLVCAFLARRGKGMTLNESFKAIREDGKLREET
jgi:hypothetical protein